MQYKKKVLLKICRCLKVFAAYKKYLNKENIRNIGRMKFLQRLSRLDGREVVHDKRYFSSSIFFVSLQSGTKNLSVS